MTYRALDCFCGAGGATKGLQMAGFHVTGVDNRPQPRYCGDAFILGDALEVPLEGYDFIWASPPCQAFTALKTMHNAKPHPDLLTPMRGRLADFSFPWVMENVPNAPLAKGSVMLCGTMFSLGIPAANAELRRHRWFEANFPLLTPSCQHSAGRVCGVYGGHGRDRRRTKDGMFNTRERKEAMAIDWMKDAELSQAIPPAYSHFIGKQAIQFLDYQFPGQSHARRSAHDSVSLER
jgi:DNA (cytosine-5)-methyltransferase 1